jgi:NADH:ubiquinone oxidoreductase subunit 3 (subunit A)
MLFEYLLLLYYLIFCFFLALILFLVSYLFVYQTSNFEKISVYECGFSPFGDSRSRFEVRFYIVAILFMIFDLEIIFLFP